MENDRLTALARRARQNDREAFGQIYDLCVDRVYRFVFYRVGRKEDGKTAEPVYKKICDRLERLKAGPPKKNG